MMILIGVIVAAALFTVLAMIGLSIICDDSPGIVAWIVWFIIMLTLSYFMFRKVDVEVSEVSRCTPIYSIGDNSTFTIGVINKTSTLTDDETGELYDVYADQPRFTFLVDNKEGTGRVTATVPSDGVAVENTDTNETPCIVLKYNKVVKGNYFYPVSNKPYGGKVWWSIHIPMDAVIKEQ